MLKTDQNNDDIGDRVSSVSYLYTIYLTNVLFFYLLSLHKEFKTSDLQGLVTCV